MRNKLDNYIDYIINKFNTTDAYIIADKLIDMSKYKNLGGII